MYQLFFILFFLVAPCWANQQFEPLFVTGGIVPIQQHAKYPSVTILQSAEQFLRFVSEQSQDVLVHIDNSARAGHQESLGVAAAVVEEWPRSLYIVSVQADTHAFLARAIARTAGLTTLSLPAVLVFVAGKAVLPPIAGTLNKQEFTAQVAQRIAYAQQQQKEQLQGWFARYWEEGSAWMQAILAKVKRYLFG